MLMSTHGQRVEERGGGAGHLGARHQEFGAQFVYRADLPVAPQRVL